MCEEKIAEAEEVPEGRKVLDQVDPKVLGDVLIKHTPEGKPPQGCSKCKQLRGQVHQLQRKVDKLEARLAKAEGRQKDSTCQHCGGDGCPACDARLQD